MERGNLKRWKEVLDDFLAAEDVAGLAHDSARKELARHFMSRGEWASALPYAEAMGRSGTRWGMDCARDCSEGSGDREKAHEWQKRVSERYPGHEAQWYLWVKKTGHGDEAAAEAVALKWLDSLPGSTTDDCVTRGTLQALRGRPKESWAAFDEAVRLDAHPYYALHAALGAMELGDVQGRDRALTAGRSYVPKDKEIQVFGGDLLLSFIDILAAGPEAPIDLKSWDGMLARQQQTGKINLPYFMGRFLELRGRLKEAQEFYRRTADTEVLQSRRLNVVLAAAALRRLTQ